MRLELVEGSGKITDAMMEKLKGAESYFIYAKVEYTDPRTNLAHYTHACWKYAFSLTPSTPSGFYNCSTKEGYSDAN